MKTRRSFIPAFAAILSFTVSILLVDPAWSEGRAGGEAAAVPIFLPGGDFSGDGLEDISVFHPESGTWRIRALTVIPTSGNTTKITT